MEKRKKSRVVKGLGTLGLLLSPSAMYASCPLCYPAAGERFLDALRSGILVLLPIPFFLGTTIAYMAYRRRDRYVDSPE